MSRKVGSIVLVLVLALCTAGAAHARPLDREASAGGGFLKAISRLFEWVGRMADGWEGSHLDPNGNPVLIP
jgi:hypothetical protein